MVNCPNCNKPIGKTAVAQGGRIFCGYVCRAAALPANPGVTRDRKPPRKVSAAELRRKLTTPSEGSISSQAGGVLERRGVYHTRLQSGARPVMNANGQRHYMKLCVVGTPDRMFADGLVTFLEIKKPGGERSPEQIEVAEKLKANGALVFTIDDFGQVDFVIGEMVRRSARIEAIAVAIQEIQKEIDSAFNEFKCSLTTDPSRK